MQKKESFIYKENFPGYGQIEIEGVVANLPFKNCPS